MSQPLENALQFAHKHASRFVDQLGEFVSIPSVSTTPERFGDVRRAGEWVGDQLRGLGMKNIQFFPPDTHPIITSSAAAHTRPRVPIDTPPASSAAPNHAADGTTPPAAPTISRALTKPTATAPTDSSARRRARATSGARPPRSAGPPAPTPYLVALASCPVAAER